MSEEFVALEGRRISGFLGGGPPAGTGDGCPARTLRRPALLGCGDQGRRSHRVVRALCLGHAEDWVGQAMGR